MIKLSRLGLAPGAERVLGVVAALGPWDAYPGVLGRLFT